MQIAIKNAYETVKNKMCWKHIASRYLELLTEVTHASNDNSKNFHRNIMNNSEETTKC